MSGTLTVGDTRPALTGTLTSDKLPVNIAGATLAIHVRWPDGTVLNRAGTIVSAAAGTWSMAWLPGDLAQNGHALIEVQVTYSDGGIQTFGPASQRIQPQLA